MEHQVYLGLGSNLGRREAHLQKAVRLVGERVGRVVRQSSVVETEPWGFESANRFLNCVILCHSSLSPRQILTAVKQIEREMGRELPPPVPSPPPKGGGQPRRRYKDRPIDIDILLYDDLTVDEPDLKIPHPLMRERDFVMIPLREIYQPD